MKLQQEDFSLPTGMEFYRVLRADALSVKARLYGVEEGHSLGRLLDIDVVEMAGKNQLQFPEQPLECLQDVVLSAMRKQKYAPVLENIPS